MLSFKFLFIVRGGKGGEARVKVLSVGPTVSFVGNYSFY